MPQDVPPHSSENRDQFNTSPKEKREIPFLVEKRPVEQASRRIDTVSKRVDTLKGSLDKRPSLLGDIADQLAALASTAMLDTIQDLQEKKQNVQDAMKTALAVLNANPTVLKTPNQSLLDSLQTIGKEGNKHAADDPQLAELRALYLEMKSAMDQRTASPNIIINNNLGPQGSAQTPSSVPEQQKLEDPKNWEERGRSMMYQVRSINDRIQFMITQHKEKQANGPLTAAEERQFTADVFRLQQERKLILTTVNALIENVRKPQQNTSIRPLSKEETVMTMNTWLLDSRAGGITIDKKGLYTIN